MTTVTLLDRTRLLTSAMQARSAADMRFETVIDPLAEALGGEVGILSIKGKVLATTRKPTQVKSAVGAVINEAANTQVLRADRGALLKELRLTGLADGGMSPFDILIDVATVFPVFGDGKRVGTLAVTAEIGEEGRVLAEFAAAVIGLAMATSAWQEEEAHKLAVSTAKAAVQALSYSEAEAIVHVFQEMDGDEGLLVASKIADRIGVTRSVIVNALRKLESAGVIQSRSLGMKGTYIKILNHCFLQELSKIA